MHYKILFAEALFRERIVTVSPPYTCNVLAHSYSDQVLLEDCMLGCMVTAGCRSFIYRPLGSTTGECWMVGVGAGTTEIQVSGSDGWMMLTVDSVI